MPGPAVEVTAARQYAAWRAGQVPPVEEIADGLWSVPVPMPGSLRYTLVYALELADGVGLVDAGWPAGPAWQALTAGLALAGWRPADIRALLVTHAHPDHYGLARRVRDASGAWVGLHPADTVPPAAGLPPASDAMPSSPGVLSAGARSSVRRAELGMPEPTPAEAAGLRRSRDRMAAQLAAPDVLIEHGSRPCLGGWDLRAIWTPGHSAGHLCLHEPRRNVLFAGDHVTPRVSPLVSALSGRACDPLGDYLSSLRLISGLDGVMVLPAHEFRYAGLADRVGELAAHHDSRLAEIAGLLSRSPGMTCWAVTHAITWARPLSGARAQVRRKAVGETLAHLIHLEIRQLAHRSYGAPQRWFPGQGEPQAEPARRPI